jgi:hypothetical protein
MSRQGRSCRRAWLADWWPSACPNGLPAACDTVIRSTISTDEESTMTTMTINEVAERLVALCRQGKFEDAHNELFAMDAISIEPYGTSEFARETKGLNAILEKGQRFGAMIEQVHSLVISDPLLAGSSFACAMHLDVTIKGHGRTSMHELCIYQVKDGKIISEQFTSRFDV